MFSLFKKKKTTALIPKLASEQLKRLANDAIDECMPEDLRELAQSALERIAND